MIYETKKGHMVDMNDVARIKFISGGDEKYLAFLMIDATLIKCFNSAAEDLHMAVAFENTYGGIFQTLSNGHAINVNNLSSYIYNAGCQHSDTSDITLIFNGSRDNCRVTNVPNDILAELDSRILESRGQEPDLQEKFEKEHKKAIKKIAKKFAA